MCRPGESGAPLCRVEHTLVPRPDPTGQQSRADAGFDRGGFAPTDRHACRSVAERTREAVRDHPFLYDALRAGVVNHTAAARFLDVDTDPDPAVEAVAAALRRYAADLDYHPPEGDARVSMESGFGTTARRPDTRTDAGDDSNALLAVGDTALVAGEGSLTAVLATGDVGPETLRTVLGRCVAADTEVEAAGVAGDGLLLAVSRRDGPDALRRVEDAV